MKKLYGLFVFFVLITLLTACNITNEKAVSAELEEMIENTSLYPAYVYQGNHRRWGYIDSMGKFVIEPQFNLASDFNGYSVAIIEKDGKYGVINSNGEYILNPIYQYILSSDNEVIVALREGDGVYVIFDLRGNVLGEVKGYVDRFSEGLALFSDTKGWENLKYGYIDTKGQVVIEPKFLSGTSFKGGKAVAKVGEKEFVVIDSNGNVINTLYESLHGEIREDIVIYRDDSNFKSGYMTIEGTKLTDTVFSEARPFRKAYAEVMIEDGNGNELWGLINKKGNFVVVPEYGGIDIIEEGLYTVYNSIEDIGWMAHDFSPKAIMNLEGKLLTDFSYYKVGKLEEGLNYVSDGTKTFIVDHQYKPIKNYPVLDGFGEVKVFKDILKIELDNELLYISKEGKGVWKSEYSYTLKNSGTVIAKKYRPNRFLLTYYPQITGFKDKVIEKQINEALYRIFLVREKNTENEEELYYETIDISFEIKELGDLITFIEKGYYYPIGAAHGTPWISGHHFNINTGRGYILEDLFIKGSNYKARLEDIIEEKMKENQEDYFDFAEPEIVNNQYFLLTENSVDIYFQVYEIASYAAGMPSFQISYEEIADIMDTKGDLWQTIAKAVK